MSEYTDLHWRFRSDVSESMCGLSLESAGVSTTLLGKQATCEKCAAAFVGYGLGRALATDQPCVWTRDIVDADVWTSSCDNLLVMLPNEDGPAANGFAYCHHCGRPVKENESEQSNDH